MNIDQERGCYTLSADGRCQCRLSAPTVIDRCRQNIIFIILAYWYLETVDRKMSAQRCWYRQETDNKTNERNEKERKKRKGKEEEKREWNEKRRGKERGERGNMKEKENKKTDSKTKERN